MTQRWGDQGWLSAPRVAPGDRPGWGRRAPWPLQVFAVDDCSAQLAWPASPAGPLRLEVGDQVVQPWASPQAQLALSLPGRPGGAGVTDGAGGAAREAANGRRRGPGRRGGGLASAYLSGQRALDPAWPGGPGAVTVEGLAPGTTYDVVASADGVPRFVAARLRTLVPPEGRLLCRFATVSDVHIGEKQFGITGRIHDVVAGQDGAASYPVRALVEALAEAAGWGAELVVAKGDLTRRNTAAEVRDAGRILARSPVPVEVMLGNHDNQLGVDTRGLLDSQGVAVPWQPMARDLPGLRLVLVQTVHGDPHYHRGQLPGPASHQVARLVAEPETSSLVVLHHPPELHRYPTVYPPGIPFSESRVLLDELAKAKPTTFVTCGHRHRNRRYEYRNVVISEVGSTKDYPGVWAGYKVFEAGILQVVRRVAHPGVMAWTEATRRALNGQWHRWSPGKLEDRCFTVSW